MKDHDASWKGLLKRKGVARALLKAVLPQWLASRIVGRPEILSESFVSDDLRESVADAVLRVQLADGDALMVFCVVEHKRSEEPFALVQVLRYMTAVYEQQTREARGRSLAPVVPVIIFNGPRAWKGPTRFSRLLSVDAPTLDFEVVLLDLARTEIDSLPTHPTLRGGLLSLKAAASPLEEIDEVLDAMMGALRGDPSTLRFVLGYLSAVAGREALPHVQRAAQRQKEEAQMQTIAEFLREQGFEKGVREGEKLGRKLGKALGKEMARAEAARLLATTLKRVLRARFGPVSRSTAERIDRATPAKLASWTERAAIAAKLGDVFAVP
ncbi:MAG: Rpn family recombination-promoting nuclease/putative transposase [Archangium sp.]